MIVSQPTFCIVLICLAQVEWSDIIRSVISVPTDTFDLNDLVPDI